MQRNTGPEPGSPFLTAEWRYLAMLNYEVEPERLMPLVPKGTELDTHDGKTFVSMVGFLFLNTRVMGLAIPFHRDFEEINLRFYVRRKAEDGWRRGVVFVKEIVPRTAIALTARWLYNENYVALPTGNVVVRSQVNSANIESVTYYWTFRSKAHSIELTTRGEPRPFCRGFAGRIHCSTPLGLYFAKRRWHHRVSGRAPAMANLAGAKWPVDLRR